MLPSPSVLREASTVLHNGTVHYWPTLTWMNSIRVKRINMYLHLHKWSVTTQEQPPEVMVLLLIHIIVYMFCKNKYILQEKLNLSHLNYMVHLKGKCKAITLQVWTGPEGSRRLRLPDFKTISIWRWYGCQPYKPAAFTSRKYSWYSFLFEAKSTPGPWCGRKDYVNEKFQWHHRESNPQPSGL